MRSALAIAVATIGLSSVATAAERPCKANEETYLECLNRLYDEQQELLAAEPAAREAMARESTQTLAEVPTSEAAGDAGGSTRDFLAGFFGALGLGSTSTEEGNLILNFRTDFLDLGPRQKAALRAVVHDPGVSPAIVAALPEGIRAAREADLEKRLDDFDDLSFEISWNRETRRLGRARHRLTGEILTEVSSGRGTELDALEAIEEEFLRRVQERPEALTMKVPADATSLDPALLRFEDSLTPFAEAMAAERQLLSEAITESSAFLRDLRDNQPQLHFGFAYRRRGDAVGPDEYLANLTYEHGFVNLNAFLAWQQRSGCRGALPCLAEYQRAVGGDVASSGSRLVAKVEFGRISAFDFSLPEDGLSLNVEDVDKRVATLTFSRRFGPPIEAEDGIDQRLLFELSAIYEDLGDDPARLDRFVAKAALSRRISDDLSAGLTVVYASRPEFRGEVDKELSARLGLKFTADSGRKEN